MTVSSSFKPNQSALQTALEYIARGWSPIPIPHRKKRPLYEKWQDLRITEETAPDYFRGDAMNIGVILGPASGGLTDVDLDCDLAIQLAPHVLPRTDAVFGRTSRPSSHWLYKTKLAETADNATIKCEEPETRKSLVELRIGGVKGAQTVFPGSVHESGEVIRWESDRIGEPATVDGAALEKRVKLLAACVLLAKNWPCEGGRHTAASIVGGVMARSGMTAGPIAMLVEAIAKASGDNECKNRRDTARDAAHAFTAGKNTYGFTQLRETFGEKVARKVCEWIGYHGQADYEQTDYEQTDHEQADDEQADHAHPAASPAPFSKPEIRLEPGEIPHVIDQIEDALLAHARDYYQRGSLIVRPGTLSVISPEGTHVARQRIMQVNKHDLAEAITGAATLLRWNSKVGWLPTDCPLRYAETYLARAGHWRLPVLTGLINAPTLRPDGTILDQPGYDAETGLLFDDEGLEFPVIAQEPTRQQAEAAVGDLLKLIETFPFVGDADRSVALSAFLTVLVRRSLPTAPLHAFNAPVKGSGKSLLVDMASAIATGRCAAVIAQGKKEEEMEKRLGAALIAGDALISIDNCEAPLRGELLCQSLTQTTLKVRILGKSINAEVLSNAAMFATGNNLVLEGDMTRRAIRCSLDAGVERPELRAFDRDPIAEIKSDRGRYVAAGLTILRAFHVAGRPRQTTPLGSFVEWSAWVRDALVWLDLADPCATMEAVRSADPKQEALTVVVEQWRTLLGDGRVSVREVIDSATRKRPGLFNYSDEYVNPDFREALLVVAGDRGSVNSYRLGNWLSANENRIVNGARFVAAGITAGIGRWRLEPVKP